MELRHLVSFLVLAEELHFGRAAQRLHLTQPSLSAQLQKLEKSLGVRLVARNSHEVKLTSAGREFEGQARLIVAQVDRAAEVSAPARVTTRNRSGRTPTVTARSPWAPAMPSAASSPSATTRSRPSRSVTVADSRFMGGAPRKPATKVDRGRS